MSKFPVKYTFIISVIFTICMATFRYLNKTGNSTLSTIFSNSCDVEVLEDIILTVIQNKVVYISEDHAESESVLNTVNPTLQWILALSSLSHFSFNSKFLNPEVKSAVLEFIDTFPPETVSSIREYFV